MIANDRPVVADECRVERAVVSHELIWAVSAEEWQLLVGSIEITADDLRLDGSSSLSW